MATVNDKYSCIEDIVKTVHVAIPFSYAGTQVSGIRETLETWKSQYVHHLGGILIDYKNVSLTGSVGEVIDDQPCIHYDVKATFSVFKPRCGSILKGIVNRISKSHVGCVVHNLVNVSIHLHEDIAYKVTHFIMLDSEITFQVSHIDAQRRVIRIKGEITPECIEIMEESLPEWKTTTHTFFNDGEENELECPENEAVSTKKSKKHKKKKNHGSDDTSTSGFESLSLEVDEPQPIASSKKSHKKRKHEEMEEDLSVITEFPGLENSAVFSSTPFEMPSKKMKKNSPQSHASFLDYVLSSTTAEKAISGVKEAKKKKVKEKAVLEDVNVTELMCERADVVERVEVLENDLQENTENTNSDLPDTKKKTKSKNKSSKRKDESSKKSKGLKKQDSKKIVHADQMHEEPSLKKSKKKDKEKKLKSDETSQESDKKKSSKSKKGKTKASNSLKSSKSKNKSKKEKKKNKDDKKSKLKKNKHKSKKEKSGLDVKPEIKNEI